MASNIKAVDNFPLYFILLRNDRISDFSANVCMLQKVSTFYLVPDVVINGEDKHI